MHQIKTPVAVIQLISESNQNLEAVQKIQNALLTIQYNLQQMLDIYRLDDFRQDFVAEQIQLNALLSDVINQLKTSFIMNDVYPKLRVDNEVFVYSDSKWLKLIVFQLLTNAIKYSDPKKDIPITYQDGSLIIQNTGSPISPSEIDRIYDLFYVGKNGRNNNEAIGIGLYIAKQAVGYIGHSLHLSSNMDSGLTTACIEFES